MSISLNANFELLSASLYLDARQQFNTIIEMKDFAETSIPDGFITYNKETQKHYVFNSSNTVDATLGKWREYNSGDSSSTTYATWNSNVDYKVGNIVLKDEVRYSCIADHTSTDFETDSINWVVVLEQYYHVTQEQYNKMVSDGLITDTTKDLYIIDGNNEGGNSSSANYTSLEALGLTAPVSVGEIFNAMPDNTMAVLACEAKDDTDGTVNISDIPESFGVLTIKKNESGRFSIDYQNSLRSSPCNVKRWIGTLKGEDGTGLYWKLVSTEPTYVALSDMGLTADATVQDVIDALPIGCTAHLRTDGFTNWSTLFNNIQWGYFKIEKTVGGLSNIELQEVVTPNRRYFGTQVGGKFSEWQQVASEITDVITNTSKTSEVPNANLVANEIHGKYFTIADYSDALTMPIGKWRVDSNSKATQMQNLPVPQAGILEVKYLQGNDGKTAYTGAYKYAMLTYTVVNGGDKYERTFNSDATAGNIVNDTGWKQVITENSKADPYSCDGYTVLTGTEDLFTLGTGHYATTKADKAYNYPITDSSSLTAHIYVLGCLNDPANNKGYRIILYFDNKNRMYRINEWWGSFNNGWQQISSTNIYHTINQLNSAKGTSIELVKGEDNTLKIVEALGNGEEFVEWFNNNSSMERFGIPDEFGNKITYLRIVKTDAQYALIIATTSRGFTFSRVYNVGVLEDWCWDKTKATLVTNTATLKLDITKRNAGWYGAIKLTYLYDTSPVEVEISFRASTDDLRWAVINGQKYIKQITFTQDSSNTAHYTIGIEFSGTTYGCYQAEVIGGFADINSLTNEAFTGAKTAVYYAPWGKNNGVTLVSTPEDIGLTYPCTTVQLVQAMRNKFNKTINAGAIGVFNCGGKTTTITDAPSDYGLLHIEVFGHDRVMIRYDGISSSSYNGSHIGQIKGSNGTFSSITWTRIDNDTRVTTLETQVNELFQSVSDGKTLVANAITGKGVSTSTSATFATMATNVGKITNYTASEKQALATAITNKGVSTSSSASFSTMATNISKIPQSVTWQEETVSAVPDADTRIARFVFSNTVLGIRQMTAPGYRYTTEATETKMFTISGNTVEVKAESGTWRMTAMVRVSQ